MKYCRTELATINLLCKPNQGIPPFPRRCSCRRAHIHSSPPLYQPKIMSGGGISAPSSSTSPISLQSAPAGSSSFWDRLSRWASENKAVVYTIAGVTVVATGAGIYYYSSASKEEDAGAADKKRAKRDKRKAKKSDEKAKEDGKAGM
jgi:hypothetical protein